MLSRSRLWQSNLSHPLITIYSKRTFSSFSLSQKTFLSDRYVASCRRSYAQYTPGKGFQGMQLNGEPAKGQALKEFVRIDLLWLVTHYVYQSSLICPCLI